MYAQYLHSRSCCNNIIIDLNLKIIIFWWFKNWYTYVDASSKIFSTYCLEMVENAYRVECSYNAVQYCKIRCRYNAVNFLTNIHKRHHIARRLGLGMVCLLWIHNLIGILLQCLMKHCMYIDDFSKIFSATGVNPLFVFSGFLVVGVRRGRMPAPPEKTSKASVPGHPQPGEYRGPASVWNVATDGVVP